MAALLVAGCSGLGGLDPGPCTPASFTAHEAGAPVPCKEGIPGCLHSYLSVGRANGQMQIPALSCESMGSDYVLVAQGQDVNVLVVEGHVTMEICGFQGPGRYTATGPDSVRFTLQTSRTEPVFRSAEDTSCEVCVNPDGKTGG